MIHLAGRFLTSFVTLLALSLGTTVAFAGVWDEMQSGHTLGVQAKIISLSTDANGDVELTYKANNGQSASGKLCKVSNQDTVAAVSQVQDLRDAMNFSRSVLVAVQGPWNPCLNIILRGAQSE